MPERYKINIPFFTDKRYTKYLFHRLHPSQKCVELKIGKVLKVCVVNCSAQEMPLSNKHALESAD